MLIMNMMSGVINQARIKRKRIAISIIRAIEIEIIPAANGRDVDFLGWIRSCSMSCISLIMYVADEARQNNKKARRVCSIACGFKNAPEKSSGAATNVFLIHCFEF